MTDPTGIVSYDNATQTLTFQTDDQTKAGTYDFTLKVRLANYPELGYFPATTDFTVTASVHCTM